MSHELRTPLNAIIGFSELMQHETFGPIGNDRYKQYVTDIFESSSHLLNLIGDILDLSKIEAGKNELSETELDISVVVDSCRRIVEGKLEEAGVTLEARGVDVLPRVLLDERAFKQILLNLLSNSIKFTPANGKILVEAEIDEAGCFVLAVVDTGIGIATEDFPKVLAPFGQGGQVLTRQQSGTGLGLSLVKSLAQAHGGNLELESELGHGTTVRIRFPSERTIHTGRTTTAQTAVVSVA